MEFKKPEIEVAVENGDLELVKKLAVGQDIVELDRMHRLLEWAVIYGQKDIAQYLLDGGVDINTVYIDTNVLEAAAGREDDEMIRFLLERGIEIMCTADDRNPASRALANNRLENFKLMLEKEKEILSPEEYDRLIEYYKDCVMSYGYAIGIMEYLGVNPNTEKGKAPTKEDRKNLVSYLKTGIQSAARDAAKTYADEEIYIFSIQADDVMSYVTVYVNTEESFKAAMEEDDENPEEDKFYYRYCEDEWDIVEDNKGYFKQAVDYVKKENLYVDDALEWDYMILDALRQIRKEGYMETLFKNPVILTIYMHDHCDGEELIEAFGQINNESVSKEYAEHIEDFF